MKYRQLLYASIVFAIFGGLAFATTWSGGNPIGTMPAVPGGTGSHEARFMDSGDLDCDGNEDDIAVIGYDGNNLVIFLSNGDGTFDSRILAGNDTTDDILRPAFVEIVDLGSATSTMPDGKPDILVGAGIAGSPDVDLMWFENTCNGNFTKRAISDSSLLGVVDGTAADIDGDGDNDVLVVMKHSSATRGLSWFENAQTDGTSPAFSATTEHILISDDNNSFSRIVASDIDNDNDIDFVLAKISSTTNYLNLFKNDGIGNFTATPVGEFYGAYDLKIADVTGNNEKDIIAAEIGSVNRLLLFSNDGNENFTSSVLDPLITVNQIDTADYDGDGDMDIVATALQQDELRLYTNNGGGSFTSETIASGLNYDTPSATTFVDIDNDSSLDIALGLYTSGNLFWFKNSTTPDAPTLLTKTAYTSTSLSISWTDNSSIETAYHIDYSVAGSGIFTTIDLSADTTSALINGLTANKTYVIRVYASNNAGNSGYLTGSMVVGSGNTEQFSFSEMAVSSYTLPGINNNPTDIQSGDLNGDGLDDLVLTLGTADEIAWFESDGNGAFIRHSIDATINNAYGAYLYDIDKDGDLDIFAVDNSGQNIKMYLNDGIGNFTSSNIVTAVSNLQNVFIDDLDNDGVADLIYTRYLTSGGAGLVWVKNGGLTPFETTTSTTLDNNLAYAYTAKTGDLNGDSHIDIVSLSWSGGAIKWYAGDGMGNFSEGQTIVSPYRANDIEIVDVNGDGDLDIIYATAASENRVVYLENNGNASAFSSAYVSTASTTGYSALEALDFDGDGDIDILASGLDDGTLIFFENDGSENFSQHTIASMDYAGASRGLGLTTGYFNNDRFTDLAIVNQTGNSVNVYYLTTTGATPNAPDNLQLDSRGANTLNISWNDNSLLEDSYTLSYREYKSGGAFTTSTFPADTTTAIISGLAPASAYEIRLKSSNSDQHSAEIKEIFATSGLSPLMYQILSTGQSLSVGFNGSPALTETQPYFNRMLSGSTLLPLVESSVETISSAMANTITYLSAENDFQSIVSNHGKNSSPYLSLKKGTVQYNLGMSQVTNAKTAVESQGKSLQVLAVTAIHGESDHNAETGAIQYEANLVEWQEDYDTDVKAITGQTQDIALVTDQMSSFTAYGEATSEIPIAQLSASENNENIYLVGPKYQFDYSDPYHLTNEGYLWLGEYYGKVMYKIFNDGVDWKPLSPSSVTRTGRTITLRLNVPVEPIVVDTTNVLEVEDYGFEFSDDSGNPPEITNVVASGSDTITITLASEPTGANERLRYAYTATAGAASGRLVEGSAKGNIRDSDPTESLGGNKLYNWLVHFDEAVIEIVLPVSTPSTSSSSSGGRVGTKTTQDSSPNTSTGSENVFTDVSSSHSNSLAIKNLYEKSIINGYPDGTFKPNNDINRAELIKILVAWKSPDFSKGNYNNCFPDVTEEWFAPYACYAKEQGWISGHSSGEFKGYFKPGMPASKVEAITMLLNISGLALSISNTGEWYTPYLSKAKEMNLFEDQNYLELEKPITRASLVESLYRLSTNSLISTQ